SNHSDDPWLTGGGGSPGGERPGRAACQRGGETMIAVSDLDLVYGASVRALRGVSFAVVPGGAVAILGSNGAGKTSLLRALSGSLRRHRATISGTITLDGRRIGGMSTAEIVRNGVV